jgi:hypothetical protein
MRPILSYARSQAAIQREILSYDNRRTAYEVAKLVERDLVDEHDENLDRMLESTLREVLSIESAEVLAEDKEEHEN